MQDMIVDTPRVDRVHNVNAALAFSERTVAHDTTNTHGTPVPNPDGG